MATVQQIVGGTLEYANKHIIPKLDSPKQFVAGMVLGIAANRAQSIVDALAVSPAVKALGVVREDGSVDLDILYAAAANQIEQQKTLSLDVPMLGRMTFDRSDIDVLYQTICRQ